MRFRLNVEFNVDTAEQAVYVRNAIIAAMLEENAQGYEVSRPMRMAVMVPNPPGTGHPESEGKWPGG